MNAVPPAPHYTSYTEARTHLKDLLDASARNQLPTVQRDNELHIVVSADRMRRILEQANPSRAQSEAQSHGGWAMFTAHPPLAVEGADFDATVDEMVGELREYAEDWDNHLGTAPNHRDYWGVVQLVKLSTDEQLREWLRGRVE